MSLGVNSQAVLFSTPGSWLEKIKPEATVLKQRDYFNLSILLQDTN